MITNNLKKVLSLFKQDDYWHGRQGVGQFYHLGELKGYYNDLTKKVITDKYSKIDKIIPMVYVEGKGFIHPVTVCQVGLGAYDLYLKTSLTIYKEQVISCSDWLLENSKNEAGNTSIFWTVPYAFKLFNMEKNFVSGLIQGQAISLLVRAYLISNDRKLVDSAYKAMNKLITTIDDGGCRLDGTYLYEEYPNKNDRNLVLNGAISAYWGIYDLYLCTKDENVLNLKNLSQDDLVKNITEYDAGFFSRYCLKKNTFYYTNIASPYYHNEHIEQLKVLVNMTGGNKIILCTLNKFEKYNNFFCINFVRLIKGISLLFQKLIRIR